MTAPNPVVSYTATPPPPFTYEAYLAAVAAVVAEAMALIAQISPPYMRFQLSRMEWIQYLAIVYDIVEDARDESAKLARRYYDSERHRMTGQDPVERPFFEIGEPIRGPGRRPARVDDRSGLTGRGYERLNINIPAYKPDWFEQTMEPARENFSKPNADDAALTDVMSRAQKEIENAPRRTTLWAVEDDPRVIGWARVEGNENVGSCAFCAMMISRGPVYDSEDPYQAGLNTHSKSRAVELFKQGGGDIPVEMMRRWHPNCDCKAVPVFKQADWPGRDHFREMQDLWNDVTGDYTGWDKYKAFRRAFERGTLPRSVPRRIAA